MENAYKKQLKAVGHKLKPVIMIAGNGVTENIDAEIERALEDHELIKIRLSIADRAIRKGVAEEICDTHKAELVQRIGNVVLIYRAAQKPNPKLSNLIRL